MKPEKPHPAMSSLIDWYLAQNPETQHSMDCLMDKLSATLHELDGKEMPLDETIEILSTHNEWRRGGDGEMTDPKKIGYAIDRAINILQKIEETELIALSSKIADEVYPYCLVESSPIYNEVKAVISNHFKP